MRVALVFALLLGLAACPAQESEKSDTGTDAAPEKSAPVPETQKTLAVPPKPAPPTVLDPPVETMTDAGLKIVAHAKGNGPQAVDGATVAVHYTGWLQDESAAEGKGGKFDSSLDRGDPIRFPLGRGRVIRGWDEGILDMRVGGKRTLIIPPDLAYGPRGQPPVIPENATLIFDVELVGVE